MALKLVELHLWRMCIRKEEQRRPSLRTTHVHHDGHTENNPAETTTGNRQADLQQTGKQGIIPCGGKVSFNDLTLKQQLLRGMELHSVIRIRSPLTYSLNLFKICLLWQFIIVGQGIASNLSGTVLFPHFVITKWDERVRGKKRGEKRKGKSAVYGKGHQCSSCYRPGPPVYKL